MTGILLALVACAGLDKDDCAYGSEEDCDTGSAVYPDVDGDGYTERQGDCDDEDPARSPGVEEVPDNGIDENCDALDRAVERFTGVRIQAEREASRVGYSLAAGDLDGNDNVDLVIGAPTGEVVLGTAYVVHGPITDDVDLTEEAGFEASGDESGSTGAAVAVAGDMDGDGLADLAVGAWDAKGADWESGLVYVIDGPADGGGDIERSDRRIFGEDRPANLGYSLAAPGDLDGDGLADLLVGAPRWSGHRDDGLEEAPGEAMVFLGPIGSTETRDEAWLDMVGEADHDNAGAALGSGDFDGDGATDLLIGGPSHLHNVDGQVWVVYGPSSGTLALEDADVEILAEASDDWFGQSVASAGDTDGDGVDDILVGAPQSAELGELAGKAWLLLGPPAASVPVSEAEAVFTAVGTGDQLGLSLGAAGDVDEDGFGDVLVSAPQNTGGLGGRQARLSAYAGPLTGTFTPEAADRVWVSPDGLDQAGFSFLARHDLTGDGAADLVIGAPNANDLGAASGLVWIVAL